MDAVRMEIIHHAARALAEASQGQCGTIVSQAAKTLGLSVNRTYTLVRQAGRALGLCKPRQRRSDAGQTALTDGDLLLISGVMLKGRRAGKWMLSAEAAIDMLYADGKLSARLSPSRVLQVMRDRGMHPEQLAAPSPAVSMRVESPNDVMSIDASVCVLYRTPKGELLLLEENGVHYKNKLHNYTRVMTDLLTRFQAAEYGSGSVATRFYIGGETTENALDFLMWVMTQRTDSEGRPMPFYGVPFKLYTDQGSAFKSAAFKNFCSVMDIRQLQHRPGNARATGLVENSNNLEERGLESRLRFMDPESITMERLQAMAELWMHWFNGTRIHSRHGMTRYAAWSLITPEQLRIAPSMEIMRALPATMAKTRRVSDNMLVSFAFKGMGSNDYDVRYVPGVSPRQEVYVSVNPFAFPSVRVGVTDRETGEIVWHQVEPVTRNQLGYDIKSPVLGESFRSMPVTPSDMHRKAIAAQAYATADGPATVEQAEQAMKRKQAPYLGQFDPLADLKAAQVPACLPRKGTEHIASAPTVEAVRLSVAEACKRIKLALKDDYDSATYAWLTKQHGDAGVPEDVVQGLIAAWRQKATDSDQSTGLRAVGGGL